jgi:3-deoxy-manno-octulosonate cytidylyltransferase (CMP-KDO synthetase)
MSSFAVVIPARHASERLPGKPLRKIAGKCLVQHVFERATESAATEVIVATDDERIREAAEAFGAAVCMTDSRHRSGTERLAEVCHLRNWPGDRIVVNLQGDEPLMPPELIDQCAALLQPAGVVMATLASPFASAKAFNDPNIVKVILDSNDDAIYFSRAAIPYSRSPRSRDLAMGTAMHHHGIYAYRTGLLQKIVAAPRSAIEECEQLEQLRALEMGIRIRVGRPVRRPGPGVDTEADLAEVERLLETRLEDTL